MASRTAITTLGLATLFVGGVVGGVLGSALWRPAPAEARSVPTGGGPPASDPALLAALEELTREVRRLGSTPRRDEREPVGESPAAAPANEDLIAALDRLSLALASSPGRVSPGGIGITPLVRPTGGKRLDNLATLLDRDPEELSRQYRFYTYQQVLDHFGPPDEIDGSGYWKYSVGEYGESSINIYLKFQDGFLVLLSH